jgi:hypothetical protein
MREREQHRRVHRPPQQCLDQLEASLVAPLEIVEHDHERRLACDLRDQLADRAVDPPALAGRGPRRALAGFRRGKHGGELRRRLRLRLAVRRGEVGVQCRHGDRVGDVGLELRGDRVEDGEAALRGHGPELGEQPRLADPGLADDRDRLDGAVLETIEGGAEGGHLRISADEPSLLQHVPRIPPTGR